MSTSGEPSKIVIRPLPPQAIRIKRPRDEAPVTSLYLGGTKTPETTSKRLKTHTNPGGPAYIFRLAHTVPPGIPFQPRNSPARPQLKNDEITSPSSALPVTPLAPNPRPSEPASETQESSAADLNVSTSRPDPKYCIGAKRQGTFGVQAKKPSALTPHDVARPDLLDRKRKVAPVRRYQLSKRARTKRPHPYGEDARAAGAVFERVSDEDEVMAVLGPETEKLESVILLEEPKKERKRPRTHPKEKAQIREAQEKGEALGLKLGYEQDEELMKKMEKMVLEYLDPDTNDGIRNLPPTPAPIGNDRIGGGLGGGTWEKSQDVHMTEDDEDGYVYDVYYRETVVAGTPADDNDEEPYGVIVFAESEDEAWWYEGADEEDADSDTYASDDEDSNAEDYHANDYPDEPVLAEDEEDEYGHGILDYSEDEDDDDDDDEPGYSGWKSWKSKRTAPGEEEYDLELDSDEAKESTMRKMVRGVWKLE